MKSQDQMNDMDIKERESRSVISITIKDKQALYMSYMPFVKNGGLFVPTKKDYNLGDEMFLLVTVMDEEEPLEISGKVVWVSPPGALANKPRGIGLQFLGDTAKETSRLIESKLGASVSLTHPTHTM